MSTVTTPSATPATPSATAAATVAKVGPKRWKLFKGKGIKINGVNFMITDANINDPRVQATIARVEAQQGRTPSYFGREFIEVK